MRAKVIGFSEGPSTPVATHIYKDKDCGMGTPMAGDER